MAVEWNYTVQLKPDDRRTYADGKGGTVEAQGIGWYLSRTTPSVEGRPFSQNIVCSPDVFDHANDAKRDALEKLSMLRCPIDKPLDAAIKWMLEGV